MTPEQERREDLETIERLCRKHSIFLYRGNAEQLMHIPLPCGPNDPVLSVIIPA